MKTYSTGQVSGMTSIPIRTIQNYVRELRDCFSESANKPLKGRQFTNLDIKRLRVIKQARAQKMSDEDIRKIFSGELYWPLMNEYDNEAAKEMILNAQETYDRAVKLVECAERWVIEVNDKVARTQDAIEELRTGQASIRENIKELLKWRMFMWKVDRMFNPYDQEEREKAKELMPKKKSIFSRGD